MYVFKLSVKLDLLDYRTGSLNGKKFFHANISIQGGELAGAEFDQ
jgi:hypothetical protein